MKTRQDLATAINRRQFNILHVYQAEGVWQLELYDDRPAEPKVAARRHVYTLRDASGYAFIQLQEAYGWDEETKKYVEWARAARTDLENRRGRKALADAIGDLLMEIVGFKHATSRGRATIYNHDRSRAGRLELM